MVTRILSGLGIALLACGCTSLPRFEGTAVGAESDVGPTISQVMTHIQCKIKELVDDESPEFETLRKNHYITTGTLTLEVTDNQTFSPSLNIIEPLLRAGTNRVVALGGQLAGTQHRLVYLQFVLDLDPKHKTDPAQAARCASDGSSEGGLKGDLGLRELVLSGLKAKQDFFYLPPTAYDPKSGNPIPLAGAAPSFSTTIDFTIIRSVGGGPTWTLTYFKGPVGGTNLLNFMKTSKDTLALAFASAGPRGKVPVDGKQLERQSIRTDAPTAPSNVEQAIRNAQDSLTRMILQRLIPQ